jgi:predicted CoA-binding protein
MANLFDKENIFLIVGATNNAEKYGSKVFLDLKQAGYNVVAINNTTKMGDEIHGTPAFTSVSYFLERVKTLFHDAKLAETLGKIVLILVVPPPAALEVVTEAAQLGITRFWFQPGSESDEALSFCEEKGFEAIHDQCIMVEKP